MRKWLFILVVILMMKAAPLQAAQFKFGIGAFTFAESGTDVQIDYRPQQSQWVYGYKYVRWIDTFHDPFTGRELSKTTDTLTGPYANYLFSPESPSTWYLGAEVLRWSRSERSLFTGEIGSDSTVAPFFGGGYMALLGKTFYCNLGLFLSPGAKLSTRTSVSSEDSSGGIDIQLHLGMAF